jgi:hypothetical protein
MLITQVASLYLDLYLSIVWKQMQGKCCVLRDSIADVMNHTIRNPERERERENSRPKSCSVVCRLATYACMSSGYNPSVREALS